MSCGVSRRPAGKKFNATRLPPSSPTGTRVTVAQLEILVSQQPERKLPFSVELDERSAVVRYRAKLWANEADTVLSMTHERGRIREVRWVEYWQRMWAPSIRIQLVGMVQQLLIAQHCEPDPDS
jgi:hypothetical protein